MTCRSHTSLTLNIMTVASFPYLRLTQHTKVPFDPLPRKTKTRGFTTLDANMKIVWSKPPRGCDLNKTQCTNLGLLSADPDPPFVLIVQLAQRVTLYSCLLCDTAVTTAGGRDRSMTGAICNRSTSQQSKWYVQVGLFCLFHLSWFSIIYAPSLLPSPPITPVEPIDVTREDFDSSP